MSKKFFTIVLLTALSCIACKPQLLEPTQQKFTVISASDHNQSKTDHDIQNALLLLQPYKNKPESFDEQVIFASNYFVNRPTRLENIEGEGNHCPGDVERYGCAHLQQAPIYRTDFFACNTFVQTVMGLLYSNTLEEFKGTILKIEYGAAGEPETSIHYYNRNNFISADFNPVNQGHGFIIDLTRQGVFAKAVKTTSAIIDRQKWFEQQMLPDNIKSTVRVLSAKDGPTMLARAQDQYPEKFHRFLPQKVSIDYIPSTFFIKKKSINGKVYYEPKEDLLNQLPSPSVIEVVRDVGKWTVDGRNIQEVIGSGINVSHVGLIYKQRFKQGDLIYPKINCTLKNNNTICKVEPVMCEELKGCNKMMFTHATFAYPDSYSLYQDSQGAYHCEANIPAGVTVTPCNRVVSMPLGDYLTLYQYDRYFFLDNSSILGIHIEKLSII